MTSSMLSITRRIAWAGMAFAALAALAAYPDRPITNVVPYAPGGVERFDTREPWLNSHLETPHRRAGVELDREEIRESARMELRALRKAAAAAGS